MKKFCGLITVLIMAIGLIACGVIKNSVVANRDEIEDKAEFARLLVKMCQENSFPHN